MRQLAFALAPAPEPTLDNFVPGRNAELLSALVALVALSQKQSIEHFVYIWGEPGCGKTHLLRATCAALRDAGRDVLLLASEADQEFLVGDRAVDAVLIDDVDRLSEPAQLRLFNLYNTQREAGRILVAAGAVPPGALGLRSDLVTRLGWGLVYQLHSLSDADKGAALVEHARSRGIALSGEVIDYLLTRQRRDLRNLLALLDALDRYSLEAKRAISVPLLRDLLSSEPDRS